MFATSQSQERLNGEANRVLIELEQEFDLMRLRARRVSLEQEATRLAGKQESMRDGLGLPVASPGGTSGSPVKNPWIRDLWRKVTARVSGRRGAPVGDPGGGHQVRTASRKKVITGANRNAQGWAMASRTPGSGPDGFSG
jgi:hypothetical protein